jgi:uncharacterized protein YdaU (DUF1376 family)
MSNMTYTLTAAQKASLTLKGRKAANKALWAMEKDNRKHLSTLTDTQREGVEKVLRDAAILAVFHEVSQTHSKPVTYMAAKPMETKAQSVTAKRLKRKARKGPKDSNGKLEAQAQRHSMQMAQTRAAKAVKTEVVEDIKGYRTEVEVLPQNPTKAHTIRKAWVDMPTDMSVEDAFRFATLQDGYGCFEDEVSLDDCL